ncbi:MAG: hypothetical protein AAF847_15870, partial [Bacteroidota bacterium]
MNFKLTTTKAFQFFHISKQLAVIGIAILLSKSGVDGAVIGNYEMLFFLMFAFTFFWVSGSLQGLLTQYPKLSENTQQQLLFQFFLFFTLMSGVIVLLLFFGQEQLVPVFTKRATLDHYTIFLVFLFFNIPTFLVEHIYLLQERAKGIVAFAAFSFGLQVIAVILPLYLGYDIDVSFLALVILSIIKYGWLLIVLIPTARISWQLQPLFDTLKIAFPLILYALIGGFAQVFDSWLVNWYYEGAPEQFAIFRYGARELPLALAVAAAFSSSMLPKLVQQPDESITEIYTKSRLLFHLLFPLAIVAALFSEWLFPIILSPAFQESYAVFNVYLLILINRLLFPHTILISLK